MTQALLIRPSASAFPGAQPQDQRNPDSLKEAPEHPLPPPVPSAPVPVQGAANPDTKPDAARRRIPIWLVALGGGLIAAAAYIYVPSLYIVSTDDAAIQADTVTIVPKVAAYVTALHVDDNTAFSAGQLLVELDPRDFQVAVDSAAASLQSAEAAKANAEAQLTEQGQVIAAAEATVQGDRAAVAFAEQQLARYGTLAQTGYGSVQNEQQARSTRGVQQGALQRDLATLSAARSHVDVLQSQVRQSAANVALEQAALDQARLNLSYTKIYAVSAGTVASRSVQVGNFVQPGQTLFSAVPNDVYIIANFKETQLTRMRAGQAVSITVDAFPNLELHGHIDSFQRGTGSDFALLPPENATGNFVKVVQRVPVKILLDRAEKRSRLLAPGMSVEATVSIAPTPRWLAPFI
jgi:membrane fusion protein (multidrug efflux system)